MTRDSKNAESDQSNFQVASKWYHYSDCKIILFIFGAASLWASYRASSNGSPPELCMFYGVLGLCFTLLYFLIVILIGLRHCKLRHLPRNWLKHSLTKKLPSIKLTLFQFNSSKLQQVDEQIIDGESDAQPKTEQGDNEKSE